MVDAAPHGRNQQGSVVCFKKDKRQRPLGLELAGLKMRNLKWVTWNT
jgi:hypothetical protein